jgi:hypothetical protein
MLADYMDSVVYLAATAKALSSDLVQVALREKMLEV